MNNSYNIRSYVLQPYTLVKDLRTGIERTNVRAVLDGDLDDFMKAALAHQIKTRRKWAKYPDDVIAD